MLSNESVEISSIDVSTHRLSEFVIDLSHVEHDQRATRARLYTSTFDRSSLLTNETNEHVNVRSTIDTTTNDDRRDTTFDDQHDEQRTSNQVNISAEEDDDDDSTSSDEALPGETHERTTARLDKRTNRVLFDIDNNNAFSCLFACCRKEWTRR
jgi:hypothetical protein